MRELIYPAIYKHFKDKYYATMFISKPINEHVLEYKLKSDTKTLIVVNSETKEKTIIYNVDNEYYHILDDNDLVIYKSLYDDTEPYARPFDLFMSKVDKKKYPDVKQEYRFELVKY